MTTIGLDERGVERRLLQLIHSFWPALKRAPNPRPRLVAKPRIRRLVTPRPAGRRRRIV
jgi:hypothetical protein